MTEFSDKVSLIRGVCEAWRGWNVEQRKAACRALFWLCDQLLEQSEASASPEERKRYVRGKLLSIQDAADDGSHSGELDVLHVQECGVCIMGMTPDPPLP